MNGKAIGAAVGLATLMGMLLAAGMWLGSLEARVSSLERSAVYYHGSVNPEGAK